MAVKGVSIIRHQGEDYTVNDPNVANEFNANNTYYRNDYVYHNGNLYRFTTDHTGSWAAGDVTQVRIAEQFTEFGNMFAFSENSNNLLAIGSITKDKTLNPSDGSVASSTDYDVSDFIPVTGFNRIYGNGKRYCFYNESKVFISGATGILDNNKELAGTPYKYVWVPDNAAYFRITIPKTGERILYAAGGYEQYLQGLTSTNYGNMWWFGTLYVGKSLNAVTGGLLDSEDYNTSDFIPVRPGDVLYMPGGARYWFYDSTKTKTATGHYSNLKELERGTDVRYMTVPVGAAYFRMCINRTQYTFENSYIKRATPFEKYLMDLATGTAPSDMKMYALGDSITKGMYTDEGSSASIGKTDQGYPFWIADTNGYDLVNLGVSGSGYVKLGTPEAGVVDDDSQQANAVDVVDDNDFEDADIITLAWGINDYKNSEGTIMLGSIQTSTSGDGTVIGNMMYCIETLAEKAPYANIIILLPMNQNRFGSTTEETNWSMDYAFNPSTDNKTLTDYRNAIKACADHYNLKVVDPETVCAINRLNIRSCLGDGLHPTIPFYKKMGLALAPMIK